MKNGSKRKRMNGKSKIILSLVAAVSFVAVLSWYQMKNAHGYTGPFNTGSHNFEQGDAMIRVYGPDGGYSELSIKFTNLDYSSTKNQSATEFVKKQHDIKVEREGNGGGTYGLRIEEQTVTTQPNENNNNTLIDFEVKMTIPQHLSYSWESNDTPEGITCTTRGDFAAKTAHGDGSEITVECHMSTGNVGITSKDGQAYGWPAINMGLQRQSHTVYYHGNGGSVGEGSRSFSDGANYTFPDAWREGYSLDGWQIDNGDWVSTWNTVCNNYDYGINAYAQWSANTYMISYDGNGEDSGWVADTTATYDQNVTINDNGYTKKGYAFVGWSTDKNAASAEYSPGQTFQWKKDGDLTLYAVWEKSSYEVTFDGNGASGGKKTEALKYGKDVALPANTFERPGYTFIGWSTDPDSIKPKYTDGQTVKNLCDAGKTYELYAIWKKTDGSFDTHNIIRDDGMFNGSIELEGQNGTGFSRDHIDSEYGRIDKDGQPGYFTDRYK